MRPRGIVHAGGRKLRLLTTAVLLQSAVDQRVCLTLTFFTVVAEFLPNKSVDKTQLSLRQFILHVLHLKRPLEKGFLFLHIKTFYIDLRLLLK